MKGIRAMTSRRGMTLVEMMIATAIMVLVMMVAMAGLSTGQKMFDTGTAVVTSQARARRALDVISYEMYSTSITTLSPPNPNESNYLRFQKNTGFVDDEIDWSNPFQIELVPSARGNAIIMWEDRDPYDMVRGDEDGDIRSLSPFVANNGLKFTLSGTRLTIEVIVIGTDSEGVEVESACVSTITLRN